MQLNTYAVTSGIGAHKLLIHVEGMLTGTHPWTLLAARMYLSD